MSVNSYEKQTYPYSKETSFMLREEQPYLPKVAGDAVSSARTVQSVLNALDDSVLSGFHLKAMLTSGMGFFTDAYDLFIIGVVLAILTPLWSLTKLETSLLASTSLIAAALGSILFGRLADFVGRRS